MEEIKGTSASNYERNKGIKSLSENVFRISEGNEITLEIIGGIARIVYHGKEFVSETVAQASPKKMSEAFQISVREANKLKMDLLSRIKEKDIKVYYEQTRILDLKEAIEGLRYRDIVNFLSKLPSGSLKDALMEDALIDMKKMRMGDKADLLVNHLIQRDIFNFVSLDMNPNRIYVEDYGIIREADGFINMITKLYLGELATRHTINEVKDSLFLPSEKVSSKQLNPARYFVFENGILDLQEFRFVNPRDIRNREGERYYFTEGSDVYVSPEFIDKVRRGEIELEYFRKGQFLPLIEPFYYEDGKPTIYYQILLDVIGSLPSPISLRLLGFVVGPPGTGKTLFFNTIKSAMGKTCLPVSLTQLSEDMFTRAEILNCRVIISSEEITTEKAKKINVDLLKKIVGGDILSERPIYGRLMEREENPIKMLVGANRIPRFKIFEPAVISRVRLIRTSNPLPPEKSDPSLVSRTDEWKAEFTELMLWNLRRLQLNNYHITDIDPVLKYRLLIEYSNPLKNFVDECLLRDPNGWEYGSDLVQVYNDYAKEKGEKEVLGRNEFYRYLEEFFHSDYRHNEKIFLGVRIRDEWRKRRIGVSSIL
jgi:phage/plasmid-associated DNA primase